MATVAEAGYNSKGYLQTTICWQNTAPLPVGTKLYAAPPHHQAPATASGASEPVADHAVPALSGHERAELMDARSRLRRLTQWQADLIEHCGNRSPYEVLAELRAAPPGVPASVAEQKDALLREARRLRADLAAIDRISNARPTKLFKIAYDALECLDAAMQGTEGKP